MTARLIPTRTVRDPDGVVLVLHGGGRRPDRVAVSPTDLSVLGMVPVALRIARTGGGRLAVHRLLNTTRGWDARRTPVMDVSWALGQLRERYGERPAALVGHSLGGRAALLAGDQEGVVAVVALNPWLHGDESVDLHGRRTLVVHGDEDRVAPLPRTEAVVRRLRRYAPVELVVVPGGKHAMLRHGRVFERQAADFVTSAVLGVGT